MRATKSAFLSRTKASLKSESSMLLCALRGKSVWCYLVYLRSGLLASRKSWAFDQRTLFNINLIGVLVLFNNPHTDAVLLKHHDFNYSSPSSQADPGYGIVGQDNQQRKQYRWTRQDPRQRGSDDSNNNNNNLFRLLKSHTVQWTLQCNRCI